MKFESSVLSQLTFSMGIVFIAAKCRELTHFSDVFPKFKSLPDPKMHSAEFSCFMYVFES